MLGGIKLGVFVTMINVTTNPDFMTKFGRINFDLFVVKTLTATVPLLDKLLVNGCLFGFRPTLALKYATKTHAAATTLKTIRSTIRDRAPTLKCAMACTINGALLVV